MVRYRFRYIIALVTTGLLLALFILPHHDSSCSLEHNLILPPARTDLVQQLYETAMLLRQYVGQSVVQLDGNKPLICNHTVYQAQLFLSHYIPDKNIDLDLCIFHLNTLRTRALRKTYRPSRCKGCFNYGFRTLLSPAVGWCGEGTKLVFLVTSKPSGLEARQVLRETCYRDSGNRSIEQVKHVFLCGYDGNPKSMLALREEHSKYGDILLEDYADSYYNLSYKLMSGLRWVDKHCPQAQFISRTADDIYNHIPRLLNLVKHNKAQLRNSMMGTCTQRAPVERSFCHRLFQSWLDYPRNRYGPFCQGKTWIMARESLSGLLKAAVDVPWFSLEDHWLGFVGARAKIRVIRVKGFNQEYYPNVYQQSIQKKKERSDCQFKRHWFSIHRATPRDIRIIHKTCVIGRSNTLNVLLTQKPPVHNLSVPSVR